MINAARSTLLQMNIFRISADMLHVVSFCIILLRMLQMKTCAGAPSRPIRADFATVDGVVTTVLAGLSLKTQLLYAIVFTCRYLDLFTNFYSMYNTVLKVNTV